MKEIEEVQLIKTNQEIIEEEKYNFFQVDALKAVMIFLVIFDHMVAWSVKGGIGVALWERISIPVFLVIMGFNAGLSFKRTGAHTIKEIYSKSYFKKKFQRYVLPFLVLYAVSTTIGLILYNFNLIEMYNGQAAPNWGLINLLTGILPFWGPGNWFIPLLLQSILVLPLLYYGFTKKPKLTLILCFATELAIQLIVFTFLGEITSWEEAHILSLFMTSILFYLSAVGLGMWFSFGYDLKDKRNKFMWILFPLSLSYLIVYQFFGFRMTIEGVPLLRGDYHFLVFPYSALLVLLAIQLLPYEVKNKIGRRIALIGKSTYHILLTQILGYGMVVAYYGTHYGIDVGFDIFDVLNLLFAWIIFIPFGILWYKIDQEKELKRRLVYYVVLFAAFILIVISILSLGVAISTL